MDLGAERRWHSEVSIVPVKRRNFERISKRIDGLEGAARTKMRVAMQDSLEDGRDRLRELISERGTGRSWYGDWGSMPHGTPGRTGSSPGRSATGRMIDAATYEISSDTKHRVRGRFGWLGRLGDAKYMPMQDQGFKHWITGEQIAGMMAMRDAARYADEKFEGRAEKVARELADFDF